MMQMHFSHAYARFSYGKPRGSDDSERFSGRALHLTPFMRITPSYHAVTSRQRKPSEKSRFLFFNTGGFRGLRLYSLV
eukprot:20317_5